MKKKKFIKDLKEDEVIHAPTKEIARKLTKRFNKLGLKWRSGKKYIKKDGKHLLYGTETCYRPAAGEYGSIDFYRGEGRTIYTIDDLLDFDEPEFKRGERVLVRDSYPVPWEERIFVSKVERAIAPYTCVAREDENKFNEGEKFNVRNWMYIKKKPNTFTRKQIAEALGVEDFEIVD